MPSRTNRGTRDNIHASGSAHATYHGSRIGPSSITSRSDHPHAAPSSTAASTVVTSPPPRPAPHTVRASATAHATSSTANATLETTPSVSPEIASSSRRKKREGASQPSCAASSTIPSVGSRTLRNGAATTAPIATAAPPCVTTVRALRPAGDRATHHTISSSKGRAAVTLINVASARMATARSSRPVSIDANAAATARATSRSLWPLATDPNSTTGFRPNAATANAARDGRTRRAVVAISATVPRLAAAAVHRNTSICAGSARTIRTTMEA